MEITSISNWIGIPSRDVHAGRRGDPEKLKTASNKPEASSQKKVPSASIGGSEEYSTVINFEFVPSGRISLNSEARAHIVDFFQ